MWTVPQWSDYLRFRSQFGHVMDDRYYTLDWLDRQLLTHQAHFLCNDRAGIIFEVRTYPAGAKDVHGLIAAGDLDSILPLIAQAEDWGRQMGCIGAVIESRMGWAKALKPYGYEPHQVALRKELI